MEKMNLRAYVHEIEKMIEGGRLEEAVAHCQHILKTFPMHIETYRLLGKAYLEARRYSDAADIFQRVLNAVPDDFVSHVGLSIISDDEARLDDAIWHMERAFEVQPSNSAIQSELRRLYGKRDGVEPAKIRLNREALANMYSQGELFNQAISEIRSILEQDPNRPDLQVMLMRVYNRSGQKVDAIETAKDLLKKNPYCMDALRVVVDVLPTIGQPENIYAYRQQLALLDPYSAYASDSAFLSNQVFDSAVILDRLEYRSATIPESSPLDREESSGVANADKPADLPPDWMKIPEIENPVSSSIPISSEESTAPVNTAKEAAPAEPPTAAGQDNHDFPPVRLEGDEEGLPEQASEKNNFPDWLNPLNFSEANEQAEPEPQVRIEPLVSSNAGTSEVPETSASTEIMHEVPFELPKTGEYLDESGKNVPDFLILPVLTEAPNLDYIEPLRPAEPQSAGDEIPSNLEEPISHPPVEEENLPNRLPSLTSEETPIIPSVESGSGLMDIPGNVPELELSSLKKIPAEETAFPDWLRAIGAGSTGERATDSAISDTQPIARGQLIAEPQPIEKSVSLETDNQEPIKSTEMAQNDLGGFIQPSQETKSSDIGDESSGLLEGLADQQGIKPEELFTSPQEISREESTEIIQPLRQIEETLVSPIQEPLRPPEGTIPPEPPDLSVLSSTELPEQPVPEVSPATEEIQYSEPAGDTTIKPEVQPVGEEKTTMVWLESLSVDQETEHGDVLESSVEFPAPSHDLNQAVPDKQPTEPALEEEQHVPELMNDKKAETIYLSEDNESPEKTEGNQEPGLNWRYETANEQPPKQMPEGVIPTSPEMVRNEKKSVISPMAKDLDLVDEQGNRTLETAGNEEPAESVEELPDWLKDLEKHTTPSESTRTDDDFFAWLQNTPAQGLESESTSEVEAPSLLDENTPIAEQTIPTNPEEWIPVEAKPAISPESSSIQEPITAEDRSQVAEPEVIEEIPSVIKQIQVVESEQAVESPQVVEPVPVEETPAVFEQPQVVEPEQVVEDLQDVEPLAPEEIPTFLKQTQAAKPEQTGKPSQGIEPGTPEELPAFLEQTLVTETEQALETPQVVETVAPEEMPAVLEQTHLTEPEKTDEPPQVTEHVVNEEPSTFPEQTQFSEPKLPIEIPVTGESTTEVEPVTIPPGTQLQPPTIKQAGMLSPVPSDDKDADLLANAQSVLEQKSLEEAMNRYTHLIRKGHLLPEVIHDLQEASSRFPMNMSVWQTLGDAYMRANRLQDALDAYTKAEELLR